MNEIFKGMDNASEIINENFEEVQPMITKALNTRIKQSGLAAGASDTIPTQSRIMVIIGGRQSSSAKLFGFYDGFTHFIHLATASSLTVVKEGDNLVITNTGNAWCSYVLIA